MSTIAELLKSGESQHLEFQRATTELASIAATVCAFLNAGGGTLVVGVDDHGKAEPVAEPARHAEQIRAYLQNHTTPKAFWSVSVDAAPKGSVIVIEVPSGLDRPYVCGGAIYIRQGAKTSAATAETIRQLVLARSGEPVRWERLPSPGLEVSELDESQIRETVEIAQRTRGFAFRNPSEPPEVLADLGVQQSGQLTNAAAVLFAQAVSLRLPQTRARAAVFATDKGGDFIDNRFFEGCAFALVEQLFAFVEGHIRVESTFHPRRAEREDRPQYSFAALREGILNAIIHRDYSAYAGGMSVSIYPGRVEIWNSGQLPLGWTAGNLKKPHPSLPPNPDMAHVFYLRGLIERVGRGTEKIVKDCRQAGLPQPTWKVSSSGITLVFQARESGARTVRPNARQLALLRRLEPGQTVKPADYYAETAETVSQRQAQRDLTSLESGGWLERRGEGPATVYVRTKQPVPEYPDKSRHDPDTRQPPER